MNVKIEKSEFVEIEGLTEAAVASSDIQLITTVNHADLPSSYLTENEFKADRMTYHTVEVHEPHRGYYINTLCFPANSIESSPNVSIGDPFKPWIPDKTLGNDKLF